MTSTGGWKTRWNLGGKLEIWGGKIINNIINNKTSTPFWPISTPFPPSFPPQGGNGNHNLIS